MCTDLRPIEEMDWSEQEKSEEAYWKMLEEEQRSIQANRLHRGTKE